MEEEDRRTEVDYGFLEAKSRCALVPGAQLPVDIVVD